MNYSNILARAWRITFKYRSLWIFGFLLALFGGGGNRVSSGNFNFNFPGSGLGIGQDLFNMDTQLLTLLTVLSVSLFGLWIVAGFIIRPVTTTAIIGLGQKIEERETITAKTGWKLGWSRWAWHIFLVDFIVGLTTAFIFFVTLCAALSPLLLFFIDNTVARILGGGATVALFCLWFFFALVFRLFISPVVEVSRRYVVLANLSAVRSIESAYHLIRRRMKDVLFAAFIMLGVNLAWGFVSMFTFLFVGMGGLVVGVLSFSLGDTAAQALTPVLLGGLGIAGVIFLIFWVFITGLFLIFQLTFWTIAFKEINFTYF